MAIAATKKDNLILIHFFRIAEAKKEIISGHAINLIYLQQW